jgi:isoquinoline 1-oxidoreductase beta subunit
VPHLRTQATRVPLPLPLTGLRSLGTFANTFAVEAFVDEVAAAAGVDPLEFRLRHLGSDDLGRRLRRALEAAAEAAGWGTAPEPGTARGVACCAYGRTVVAHVVQAEVVPPAAGGSGAPRLRARRVTAAVEGRFVNPAIARQQSEGGVVMGLSWALVERVRLEGGRVLTDDADRYPVLGAADVPDVDTVLLDGPHRGGGVNEATTAPVAAALANAAFALTGHRLRELPLRLPG